MMGRPTPKKTPTPMQAQFAQTISEQFVQLVPLFLLSNSAAENKQKELAQTLFIWVGVFLGGLPSLELWSILTTVFRKSQERIDNFYAGKESSQNSLVFGRSRGLRSNHMASHHRLCCASKGSKASKAGLTISKAEHLSTRTSPSLSTLRKTGASFSPSLLSA